VTFSVQVSTKISRFGVMFVATYTGTQCGKPKYDILISHL